MNFNFRRLGLQDYHIVWTAMKNYSANRTRASPDELWFVEHPAVYTLGLAGREEHVLAPGRVPVVRTDRGGQVTLHAPGQLVIYVLLDLKRAGLGIRSLVEGLEQTVIEFLAGFGITGERLPGAPGVYVGGAKIAALGLRVKRGCSYHGLAINVNMDLSLFCGINPCGYPDMRVTQLREHGIEMDVAAVANALGPRVQHEMSMRSRTGRMRPDRAAAPIAAGVMQ